MLYLEAPTVSGILDKLQKAELIERSIDPKNRRNVLVMATQKSEVIREEIEAATIKLNNKVLQNLSDSDTEVLKKALEVIIKSDFS